MSTSQDNSFGILMYHRVVLPISGVSRPTWNVARKRFRRQLEGLLSRGYQPWPLRRLLECRGAGEPIPPRTFAVTFDDGYECIYHNAWPILKELAVPATVFVVTACLDSDRPFYFDDWAAAGSNAVAAMTWKPLSTAQCSEMIADGLVDVGSHTHTHADFRGRREAFRQDLTRSLDVLNNTFGVKQAPFAFPFGRCDADMAAVVREAGVSCALVTRPELIAASTDPFAWGRFNVGANDSAMTLTMKLNGWYTALRRGWHWLRQPWEAGRTMLGKHVGRLQPTTKHDTAKSQTVSPWS